MNRDHQVKDHTFSLGCSEFAIRKLVLRGHLNERREGEKIDLKFKDVLELKLKYCDLLVLPYFTITTHQILVPD